MIVTPLQHVTMIMAFIRVSAMLVTLATVNSAMMLMNASPVTIIVH